MSLVDRREDFRADDVKRAPVESDLVSPRPTHNSASAFPPGALNSPVFEGIDIAGLVAAIAITLGPLAAYSLGLGA